MEKDNIREGLICVLGCVEPCLAFDICFNKESKKLEIVSLERKCMFNLYRHSEVSRAGNYRYLEGLSSLAPLNGWIKEISNALNRLRMGSIVISALI